jgi:hypothetical protein
MSKVNRQIWIWSLLFLFGVTIYYDTTAYRAVTEYNSYTKESPGVVTEYRVVNPFTDYYYLEVAYFYEYSGQKYRNQQRLEGMLFRNRFSAEEEGKKYVDQVVAVWVNEEAPATGMIERIFPLREAVYAGLLSVLTLYWFGLGLYIAKIKR